MKIYRGVRLSADEANVTVETKTGDRKLPPRFDVRNHSPTGFEWGYNGSGPAQLALAILCDSLRDVTQATKVYMEFKDRVVATWKEEWAISEVDVREWAKVCLALREMEELGVCSVCDGRRWLHMVSDSRGQEIERCDECSPKDWHDEDARKKHDNGECVACKWSEGGEEGTPP